MENAPHIHEFPMTRAQVDELLERLSSDTPSLSKSKRRMERSIMRDRGELIVYSSSNTPDCFEIPICNLSPTGICFLHHHDVRPGQRFTIRLPHYVTSGEFERDILIMRCREVSPSIFEVGAEFIPEFFD